MADEEGVWGVKNSFFLGCYQQAISEALGASVSDTGRMLCDFYMYRSYIEQGQHRMVLDEVGPSAPLSLQAVKLLATYLSASRDGKDLALTQLKEWLSSPSAAAEPQLLLVAGLVFCHEADYKEALKYTHQSTDLETMSLVVHVYLLMSRLDLARKQVGLMQQSDDDATLTKLAGAWVAMAEGGDKYQEAYLEFQELGEKYNLSLMLTNGMALASLHMARYEEAERLLQEALSKSASDVDTLANMVVCMHQLRKPPEVVSRYVNQLRSVSPTHPWVVKYTELDASFDRCAVQFAAA
eukprot:CAMPEP_0115833876 /NCGR_PEP_ID=MMETSP0287-20121206/3396_1 /TAXON_ID=412157 /ORGANISM="Chrysochromulina rotalis, Strain UIO044" /LENGTH=295 /DNA_ID=CAMNT_0003287299 /DNA_START=45 /DNA_END=932 /DNA_ORIENTATION=+